VFTVTGVLDGDVEGRRREVTWRGRDDVVGDAAVVRAAWQLVARAAGVAATPTSSLRPASLAEPFVAMVTLAEVFGGLGRVGAELEVLGDVPAWPEGERGDEAGVIS
jgi:hypothetical protein